MRNGKETEAELRLPPKTIADLGQTYCFHQKTLVCLFIIEKFNTFCLNIIFFILKKYVAHRYN